MNLVMITDSGGGGPEQSVWIFSDNTTGDYAGVDGGIDDVFLNFYEQTQNEISSDALLLKDGEFAALIRADGISSIPPSRVATSVTIGLYRKDGAGGTPTRKAARLLRDWVENQATWTVYSTGNNWGTPGATNSSDQSGGASDSSGSDTATTSGWQAMSFAGLVTDVNNIINGTNSNHGWKIVFTGSVYPEAHSSRGTDGFRPYIRIETEPA